jgi:protein-disulfide isomerase
MRGRLVFPAVAAAAAAALLAPLSAAPAQKGAAAPQDWTRTVAMTPEGGFRMGNPNAKVKLVEYGSMTCPHCAEFSQGAKGPIASHVRSGRVSFEFRNFVLNGVDVTATLLARCAGPANFFPLTESLFATQGQWVGKISGLSEAEKDKLKSLGSGERLGRLADIGGLTQLAAQAGVAPARAKQCLADEAGLTRLGQMAEAATALGVQGTPTFFVNGTMVHAHSWAELEPAIRNAGG